MCCSLIGNSLPRAQAAARNLTGQCDQYHSYFVEKRLHCHLCLSMRISGAVPISGNRKVPWCCSILCVLLFATLCSPATQQQTDTKHQSSAKADQQRDNAEAGREPAADSDSAPPVDRAEFVGAETCKSCHEEEAKTYDKGPHSRLTSAKHKGPQWQGCEACHGAGREHAESGDPSKIIRFAALTREEASGRCLKCHAPGGEHAKLHRSEGINGKGSCLDCHSIHGSITRSQGP